MRPGIRTRFVLLLAGALLLFLAIILLTYRGTQRIVAANQRTIAASADVMALDHVLGLVQDAESGQRGFLLTGSEAYLVPYHRAIAAIPQGLTRLPARLDHRDEIERLVRAKVDELNASVRAARDTGLEAGRQVLLSGAGLALMDSLRAAVRTTITERQAELRTLMNRDRSLASGAFVAITALSIIGLGGLVGVAIMVLRMTAERRRMYDELEEERNQLEFRVRDRTAELVRERSRAEAAALEAERAALRTTEALRERVAAEQARAASEAQHRTLVEQVRDYAIFAMDLEGRAITWNEGVQRVLGFAEHEFLGQPPEIIFTPEDVAAGVPQQEMEQAAREGSAGNDRWMMRKDGKRFFANGVTTATRDRDGTLIGFSKVMRDQTAAKLTEDALRESETTYRLVARATREAIWDWDIGSGRLTWNEGIGRLFGYVPDLVEPTIAWREDKIAPEDRERVSEGIRRAILEGEEYWNDEYRFRRSDGQYAEVSDRGFIDRDATGRARRMIGTMADITERRRAQEKLAEAQRMESVGRLAGGIAHDLNNMLTAIVGYSSFVLEDLESGDRRRGDLTEILRAAERSASLTRSLLVYARREMVQPTPIDLNEMVQDMGRILRSALGEAVRVTFRLTARPATVNADRSRIEQVLLNLALNARDAMPQGGELTITSDIVTLGAETETRHPGTDIPHGTYVRLSVIDTGHGMDRPTLARVFEPFFTTKAVGEGTGLGLATAYGSIKQAGGFIWAYSEPGYGSVFNVYLPVYTTRSPGTGELPRPAHPRGGTEHILVVEDEPMVRALAERTLRSEGYQVQGASNGKEALDLLRTLPEPPDLVITDLVMPDIGGRELADRLQHEAPHIPVIFSSGFTDDHVIRRGLLERGQPFLQKPWTPGELLSLVRDTLDRVTRSEERVTRRE